MTRIAKLKDSENRRTFAASKVATLIGGMAMIGIGVWVIVQATGRLRKAKSSTEPLQDARTVISQHIMFSNN
jgi:hypothetical protein